MARANTPMLADLDAIKGAVSLVDLFNADGHTVGRNGKALCPFHEERTPSCKVDPLRFHCFGGCGERGDAFDYWCKTRGVGLPEAVQALGGGKLPFGYSSPARAHLNTSRSPQRQREPEPWPAMREGTPAEIAEVAKVRGLSEEAIRMAQVAGWLRFGMWKGERTWFILDRSGHVSQARRMDGKPWAQGRKADTLPGGRQSWPLGILDAARYPCILITEGGPDWFAAIHFMLRSGRRFQWCPVSMLGASNNIHADALPHFKGKRVRIFGHDDAAGHKAVERWSEQLYSLPASLDAYSFDGLTRANGVPVNDLNDAALITEAGLRNLGDLLP